MTTSTFSREKISQAIDGDLGTTDVDTLVQAAGDASVRQAWVELHQVGELLRSEESNTAFSAGFNDRLFARLDLEPAHTMGAQLTPLAANVIAMPAKNVSSAASSNAPSGKRSIVRRFMLPGAAAAAVVAVATMFSAPSLMVAKADKAAPVVNTTVAAPAEALASNHMDTPQLLRDPKVDAALQGHKDPTAINTGSENFTRTTDYDASKDK